MNGELDLSCPGLTFDAEKHEYFMHGVRVPNVTTIMDEVIGDTAKIPRENLRRSRILGDAVHFATELDDLRTIDEDTVGSDIAGYLRAWRQFKKEHDITMYGVETRLFNPVHRYSGTADRIMDLDDRLTVLDIKTGIPWASHGPQTAAYQRAIERKLGQQPHRACVYLSATGHYALKREDGRDDWGVFLSCLTVYNFKRRNNGS